MVDATKPHATETLAAAGPASKVTYTVKEIAEMLGLNLGGTYQLIRAGEIPAVRLGSRWIVPKHRFHAWLNAQDGPGTAAGRAA
jgi:excisionase family DNA binding protein